MTSALALRRSHWYHPEAGAFAVAALAWLGMLAVVAGPAPLRELHAQAHRQLPVLAGAAGWMLMTVAMMVPTALPVARDHALGALWSRRQRTIALFIASYLAVWAAFGALAAVAVALAERTLDVQAGALLGAALLAGAAWELTRTKWRAVRSCHRVTPLPPRGAKASRACTRAGIAYGRLCMVACWPAMLAMAVAGHANLGLMSLLAAVIAAEKLLVRPAAYAKPFAAVLAFAALVSIAG